MYFQDDFRQPQELTVNMGLRYDIYPPWTEIEDRQSNFDVTTGKFVVASDAVIEGVNVGRYLQTYSKGNVGPRFGFAYDLDGRGKSRPRRLRRVLELLPAARRPRRRRTAVPQSTSLNPRRPPTAATCCSSTGLPPPPGVDPNRPPAGATRSIFDIDFRDAYARSGTSTTSAASAPTTWPKSPTWDRRGARWSSRWTSTRRRRSWA